MSADFDFLHLPEIDSTNSEARRQAEAGADAPLWIIADSQTAGRGRRGRQWQSPVGNLMTTLLLPGAAAPASSVQAGQLAFVAGLALHATIAHYLAGQEIEVSLKWPNDVLVEGAKISGILLETASTGQGRPDWLAIGLGLNLAHHPEDTPYPATSLAAHLSQVPHNLAALGKLAEHFDRYFKIWQQQRFPAIADAWRQQARNLGAAIEVRLENRTLKGIFEDIDAQGALILRLDDGATQVIATGDVFFPTEDKND
jgi:BirA family biotin operon repressor/biotin-[acetyl-CoA-carboxylase] ligase